MRALRSLVVKDLRRFVADRRGALLTIAMPVVLASLLGSLFAPDESPAELTLLVVDLDDTAATAALVQAIDADEGLAVVRVTEEEAKRRIERGDARLALVLTPGTGKALTPLAMFSGERLGVRLLYDPSRKTECEMAAGLLTKITMQQVGQRFTDPAAMRDMFDGLRRAMQAHQTESLRERLWMELFEKGIALAEEQLAAAKPGEALTSQGLQAPLDLQKEAVTAAGPGAGYNTYAHNFAGMLCMFLLFYGLAAGKDLLQERDSGSLLRVRLAPVSHWTVFAARGLSAAIVALVVAGAVYAVAFLVFRVRILGSVAGFGLVLGALAVFVGGFAVLLAGIGRSERQIDAYGSCAILVMSFVGGAWFPSFLLPEWVQAIARALPTYWSLEGLSAMTWRGLPLGSALLPAGVLSGFGLFCMVLGVRLHRWE